MDKKIILEEKLENQINEAADVMRHHGVAAFPTETVMGLGVIYDDKIAFETMNKLKRQRGNKPYTLMLADVDQISLFAEIDERAKRLIQAFMPGPLTIILRAKEGIPNWINNNNGTIGVRVPSDPITSYLLRVLEKPLLVPSANRSGMTPLLNSDDVKKEFLNEIDYVVEGKSSGWLPSTVIDLTGEKFHILREGEINENMINKVLNLIDNPITIALGSDHGGFNYKEEIKKYLSDKHYKVLDVGTYSKESTHYPLFAFDAAKKIITKEARFGILVCTTGEGIMIAANKVHGIRCALGYSDEATLLSRKHNDANMIAFSEKYMNLVDVLKRVDIFLDTEFEGGRHAIRVDLISNFEK